MFGCWVRRGKVSGLERKVEVDRKNVCTGSVDQVFRMWWWSEALGPPRLGRG